MNIRLSFQIITLISIIGLSTACDNLKPADLVIHNARIYTVDSVFSIAEAMAIKGGRILEVGPEHQIRNKYQATKEIDAKLQYIYPGFIDGHCHFLGYGQGFFKLDLLGTESWNEVLKRCEAFAKEHPEGWLVGRGWDQNDWESKAFPNKASLDSLFPDRPVVLRRIDGHAAIANSKALELAEITAESEIIGGKFLKTDGELNGMLIDNAIGVLMQSVPEMDAKEKSKALKMAEEDCVSVGLTTLSDAGTAFETIELFKEMHKNGDLKIRLYAMLSPTEKNKAYYLKNGIYQDERLNIRSFKYYADGALGSRGAYLKAPYHDDKDNRGLLLRDSLNLLKAARELAEKGFQMNTHCIGDKANQLMLNIYAEVLGGSNDRRWRIEHSQVVADKDLELYGAYNVIPSVQPTHATSDMYWLQDRLGSERAKQAYAYQELLEQNGLIALGTDFPVEDIDPLKTFYAAVFRIDAEGYPEGGFQMENALSREDALKGMTIWNAIANFEEAEKGSLEKGKFADFVLLDTDLLKANAEEIKNAKVLSTYLNGELVFGGN